MTSARLHVLTALASPDAVVLRRGPAAKVASLGWDRATGAVTVGQWLAGRIYEYRCDLSPDGRHMIYFATKQSRATGHLAWTALSRAPWLRAIRWQPQDSTWGGGGAFAADGALWSTLPGALPDGLRAAPQDAFPHSTDGVFTGDTNGARLRLRGWRHQGGESHQATHVRDLPGGGVIEHRYAVSARNRAIVSSVYRLCLPGVPARDTDWEWADLWQNRLQFAASGALWQVAIPTSAPLPEPHLIHDFNTMTFEALPAPYEGPTP